MLLWIKILLAGDEGGAESGKKKGKSKRQAPGDVTKAKQWICERYYDVRTFADNM